MKISGGGKYPYGREQAVPVPERDAIARFRSFS